MRVKIVIGIILVVLFITTPMAYMVIQEDFRDVVVGTLARIICTVSIMAPCISMASLQIWSMKKRGKEFNLIEEWYR